MSTTDVSSCMDTIEDRCPQCPLRGATARSRSFSSLSKLPQHISWTIQKRSSFPLRKQQLWERWLPGLASPKRMTSKSDTFFREERRHWRRTHTVKLGKEH